MLPFSKSTRLFYLTTLFLLIIIISGMSYFRYTQFVYYQTEIAKASTSGLAHQISAFISEQNRQVTLFAQFNTQLLEQYIQNPDDEKIENLLVTRIITRFPDFYAFTISDNSGNLYLENFGEKIGQLCENDIKQFSKSKSYLPQIHPGPGRYHFDVMALFANNSKILFISFAPTILSHIIKNIEIPGHTLMLVVKKDKTLIEITALGARNKISRDDYRLNAEEEKRILYSEIVPSTKWTAIDLQQKNYFSEQTLQIFWQALIAFGIFVLFIIIVSLPILRIR